MNKFKRAIAAGLLLAMSVFVFAGCSRAGQGSRETKKQERGPLDVKKVTYLVYSGDQPHVDLYIISEDLKGTHYSINDDFEKKYDYLEGELPSEDQYEVSDFEVSESEWNNIKLLVKRCGFMELPEELPPVEGDDIGSTYIKIETSKDVNKSGGYGAGAGSESEHVMFARVRDAISDVIRNK